MADKKLSELTSATTPLAGTELVYVAQGGAPRKTTPDDLATYVAGAGKALVGKSLTLSGNQSAPAWTTNGIKLVGGSSTLTDTTSSGTVAAAYTNVMGGDTIAASSATTFTDYATLNLSAPAAGTNVTMTRKWALFANAPICAYSPDLNVDGIVWRNSTYGGKLTNVSGWPTCQTWGGTNVWMFNTSGNFAVCQALSIGQANPDGDTILARDAAGTLAQRNGANAQAFRVYNTYTDASNYERAKVAWESNVLRIGTEKGGTGTARALELQTGGTTRLTIGTDGNTTLTGAITTGNIATAHVGNLDVQQASGYMSWATRSTLRSPADGKITLFNQAENSFTALQFGGVTSSFPALKRNGTAINFRLADDSADAPLTASTLQAATAYTVATLPTVGTPGRIARVTDGDASLAWGATVVNSGSGATPYLVWDNGTAWTVLGK